MVPARFRNPSTEAIGIRTIWNGMKQAKRRQPNSTVSPRNRHLVSTYPFSAPMNVEMTTAGTTIWSVFQK